MTRAEIEKQIEDVFTGCYAYEPDITPIITSLLDSRDELRAALELTLSLMDVSELYQDEEWYADKGKAVNTLKADDLRWEEK